MARTNIFTREKVVIALIPVIGSIIVAVIATNPFNWLSGLKHAQAAKPTVSNYRNEAGKINEIVQYGNYLELYPLLSEIAKPDITKDKFTAGSMSMHNIIGDYIKPVDTTQAIISGVTYYSVKSRHKNGQSLMTVAFDDQAKIIYLYIRQMPQ
jgi:hypothetical protein